MAVAMDVAAEALPSVETDLDIKPEPEEKPALTPPASIEADKPDSSVDEAPGDEKDKEEDDLGEIIPDHYYGGGEIPVFKPTMKEFASFPKYIRKIDKYGMQSGIVKVIPPKEWTDALPQLHQMVKTIKVKNPITQEFHGQHGIYTQANMEKQRSYNLPQWLALTEESNHQPPAKRGERRRNQEKEAQRSASLRAAKPATPASPATPRGKRGRRSGKKPTAAEPEETADSVTPAAEPDRLLTPASPAEKQETPSKPERPAKAKKTPEKSKAKSNGPKSVSSRRTHNTSAQMDEIDEEAFKGFDYRDQDQEQWTAERCRELETHYWKSLNFSNPMYGADMPGSLFDDSTTSWNVAKLENLLDVLGTKVPGVNTAYLYLGMWKATFAWHLEDVDLYSINYIHFGAPKQWYSISQKDARKFEKAMKSIWTSDAKNCDQFLRHKTYLVSPQILKQQYGVEVNRLVHYEGEFVITFPYGYHSGYNIGYNCAESVNFATESWLEYGKIARKCNCEADSVWVDVFDIERKLRGEPTPEYEEEYWDEDEDDEIADLPTPPASDKDQVKASRKRKLNAPGNGQAKRVRLTVKSPPKPVCKLCPNDYSYEPLLPTEEGDKAHRLCATYVPETYVTGPEGGEVVAGVRNIDKKRLELKCLACRSKHGAVFQCSSKKCARAYHATCAAAAGASVEIGMTSWYGEDGTEYQDIGVDFRCRFHRPKRPKYADENACVEALEKDAELQNYAQGLQEGDCVQYQYFNGDIRAGYVVENRESEQMLLLYAVPQKTHIEVEWKYVLYLDKANQQLKPPSKDALPMPAHLAHKAATSQDDPTSDTPKADDPFHDATAIHKWADFQMGHIPRNIFQVAVDLAKPKSLWHYLGKSSTEARAQYTHDVAVKVHNPLANFLDTVAPAPSASLSRKASATSSPAASRHPHHALLPSIAGASGSPMGHPIAPAGPSSSATGKRPRGRPLGSFKKKESPQQPWLQNHMIDPAALRNQQAFMVASTMQSSKPLPPYSTNAQSSVPGAGYRPPPATGPPLHLSTHIAPSQLSLAAPRISPTTDGTHPSRAPTHSHTPPSTASLHPDLDAADAELLKKLAPYPYLLRCAKSRPAVYQSPYGPPGIINDAYLPFPGRMSHHHRHSSLSQDFLAARSPDQRASVQGHVRAVSTEKAERVAQEAERRQREHWERQQQRGGSPWFATSTPPPRAIAPAPPPGPYGAPAPHPPYAPVNAHTAPYPSAFHPPNAFHAAQPPRHALQFASPHDFQQQMAREAASLDHRSAGSPHLTTPRGRFPSGAKPSSREGPGAGPGSLAVHTHGMSVHTPPPSSHGAAGAAGAVTDGTSGSPLRVGRGGAGGETLPVMRGCDD